MRFTVSMTKKKKKSTMTQIRFCPLSKPGADDIKLQYKTRSIARTNEKWIPSARVLSTLILKNSMIDLIVLTFAHVCGNILTVLIVIWNV